jgi:hypothetical protein
MEKNLSRFITYNVWRQRRSRPVYDGLNELLRWFVPVNSDIMTKHGWSGIDNPVRSKDANLSTANSPREAFAKFARVPALCGIDLVLLKESQVFEKYLVWPSRFTSRKRLPTFKPADVECRHFWLMTTSEITPEIEVVGIG